MEKRSDPESLRLAIRISFVLGLCAILIEILFDFLVPFLPFSQTLAEKAVETVAIMTLFVPVCYCFILRPLSRSRAKFTKAEAAWLESQASIQGIIDAIPTRIFWKDANLRYLGCNAAFAHDAGFDDPREVAGKDDFQMEWRDMADVYRAHDHQVMETGSSKLVFEEPRTNRKGETLVGLTSKIPLCDSQGGIRGVIGMFMDITERKKAAESSLENEALLARAERAAGIGSWKLMLDSQTIVASMGAKIIYGVEAEKLTLADIQAAVLPEYRPMLDAALSDLVVSKKPYDTEFKIRRDRDRRILDIRSLAEFDQENNTVFGVIQDITERKQTEEALLESQRQIEFVLGATKTGMDIIDEQFTIRYVDPQWSRTYGAWEGRKCYEYFSLRSEPCQVCSLHKALETRKISVTEHAFALEGNRPVQITSIPYQDKSGTWLVAEINVDISERKAAEQAIRRSEERLQRAQYYAHVGSWTWDIKGNRLEWSDEMFRIFGIRKEGFSGSLPEVIARAIHPEDRAKVDESNLSVVQQGKPVPLEYRIVLPDGSVRTVWAEAGELLRDDSGDPQLLSGYVQDITERKKTEEALRVSEQLIEGLLNAIPAGVFWKDRDLSFQGCNDAFARDAGLGTPKNVLGKSDFEMSWREQAEAYRLDDRQVIEAGRPKLSIEEQHMSSDGVIRTFLTNKVPLRDREGEITGILGISMDITDRKKAEEALQEDERRLQASEDKYRRLIEMAPEAVYIVQDEKIVFLNGHACQMLGYAREEMIGMPLQMINHREDWGNAKERYRARAADRHIGKMVSRHVGREGQIIWVECVGERIEWEGKDAVLYFTSDINDRVTAENEKRAVEQSLQQMQRLESLGILAGGIAHDFNNILMAIFGYTDLARETITDETAADYLSQAMQSMERARGLTQQLLTFSKGGTPIKLVVSLPPLIKETCQFSSSGSNVNYTLSLADGLWNCKIDKNQIGQVIQNLMINAIQAMPMGGTIEVSAENVFLRENDHPTLKEGRYVRLAIRDQGIGISRDMLPRIFDPFFTTKTKGHGLGLAISYSITKRHEGAIDVESDLGKGTTFKVFLPACDDAEVELSGMKAVRRRGAGRILVMDDEPAIRNLLSIGLQSAGYIVIGVESGAAALDSCREAQRSRMPFAAAILDLTIPGGMGGKEAALQIRRLDAEIPIIFASGYAADPIMADPHEHGANASISKPFVMTELLGLLEKHIRT